MHEDTHDPFQPSVDHILHMEKVKLRQVRLPVQVRDGKSKTFSNSFLKVETYQVWVD